ncbi:uncharacterized protein LOC135841940 [Planococcus citri]|uniref:uncharacterized protein LOC135841940 n=1 Tax=Planococcus citri TaxID=170843 RepID=UPI0031F986C8
MYKMSTMTEMLCMFCLRSVTTTSPVCEQNDTFQENVAITRCRHLMHMSCFVYAHPSDPVTCRHPKCGKVINCNQVDVVEAILQDRIIVKSEEKTCNPVEEVTTRLNEATCNLVEVLTTRLKVAEDKIAQVEANSNRNAELVMEADKRASEAKAAELDAKKRYDAAKEKIAQLEANSNRNAELVMEADKRASEAKAAELETKKRHDALLEFFITHTKDCKNKNPMFNQSVPLLRSNELSPPGQTPPALNAPFSGSNNVLELEQNPEIVRGKKKDTSNVANSSKSTSVNRRKMKAQKINVIAQEDGSSAAKRRKGLTESSTDDYERYWQRFGVTPPSLKPFFPLNSFPLGYTAADIRDIDNVRTVGIFAYDALILGDGHAFGIANYVLKDKPLIKDQLSESLYRRDLGIVELIATLNRFTTLPAKIILSIGTWDATQNMPALEFLSRLLDLLEIFSKFQVRVLYPLPLITYLETDLYSRVNRSMIDGYLNLTWGKTFGGQYKLLSEMVSNTINDQRPRIDDKGPMYALNQYAPLVEAIRDRFIPVAMNDVTNRR